MRITADQRTTGVLLDHIRLRASDDCEIDRNALTEGFIPDEPLATSLSTKTLELQIDSDTKYRILKLTNEDPFLLHVAIAAAKVLALSLYGDRSVRVDLPPFSQRGGCDRGTTLSFVVSMQETDTVRRFVEFIKERLIDLYSGQQLITRVQRSPAPDGTPIITFDGVHGLFPSDDRHLALRGAVQDGQLAVRITYRSEVYEEQSIEILGDHVVGALGAVARGEPASIAAWRDSRRVVPTSFAGKEVALPTVGLKSLFEMTALRSPSSTAIVLKGGRLTYADLRARALSLSRRIREQGVRRPNTSVAIVSNCRGAGLIGILGAIYAGCPYACIPGDYPITRTAEIVRHLGANIVLSDVDLSGILDDREVALVPIVDGRAQGDKEQALTEATEIKFSRPLAIFYTSSSTGDPKGVVLTELAILNRLHWMWRDHPLGPNEVTLFQRSPSVVGSIWEVFGGLLQGIVTVIADTEDARDPRRLIELVRTHQITRLAGTPTLLRSLLDEMERTDVQMQSIELLYSSAEPLTNDLVIRLRKRMPRARLLNMYGSTECASNCSVFELTEHRTSKIVPIGRPIDNVRLYVMGADLKTTPEGVVGELCVSGACLARGYLANEALTASTFIPNPYCGGDSLGMHSVVFRTGDLARVRGGSLELVGRSDDVVKIRGFRVDIGEVEKSVVTYAGVHEAVVLASVGLHEERTLHAFVRCEASLSMTDLRVRLSQRLPSYMCPVSMERVDQFPRTQSGKVNKAELRKRLRKYGEADGHLIGLDPQRFTMEIMQQELGTLSIGADDRFMEAGVDSISVLRIRRKLEKESGREIPLVWFFQFPTVSSLARKVFEGHEVDASLSNSHRPIRKIVKRRISNAPTKHIQ